MEIIKKGDDWFHLFQKGEEHAFRQVFEKYYRPVSYFALKILNDDLYAEDIVSETFNKAWKARAKFTTARHLENFLYLVTRNGCISYLRSERVSRKTNVEWVKLAASGMEDETQLDLERVQVELLETIFEKLKVLPGGDVLRMSYIEGKSTRQIAEELNITENNVYIIKCRALKSLRMVLTHKEWMFFALVFIKACFD